MKQRMDAEIVMLGNTPVVKMEPFEETGHCFDVLCRNLHTLVGIPANGVNYDYINQKNLIPTQHNYASVAIIEEVAHSCSDLFQIGDKIVITPYLKKYIGIENLKRGQRIIYRKVCSGIDDVDYLFYPLLCYSLALMDEIADYEKILFLGCNLTGSLLLKLLREKNISPIIHLDELDISEKLIYKNGVDRVFAFHDNGFYEMLEECEVIVLNSCQEKVVDEIQKMHPHIPIVRGKQWNKEHENRAFDMLKQQMISFEDFISHHEHAENISILTEEMKINKYKGKAIIFDW